MSIQVVIDNNRTKQYLYCTQGYHALEPEHCFGDVRTVANTLSKIVRDGRKSYYIWAAHIICDFVKDCQPNDLDIHTDEYFSRSYTDCGHSLYQQTQDLDEWCHKNGIAPDEWIK